MLSELIVYCLVLYFVFHVLNRASFTARLRGWIARAWPQPVAYATTCAFCWTFHWGWVLMVLKLLFTGTLSVALLSLCAAPVVNLVLDLLVKALLKVNEPPLLNPLTRFEPVTTTTGGANTVVGIAENGVQAGQIVSIPSVWVPDEMMPEFTTYTWRSPGIPHWAEKLPEPLHVGRRVKVVKGGWQCEGKTGTVTDHFIHGDDCSGHYGKACYTVQLDEDGDGGYTVYSSDCILLDDDAPGAAPVPAAP